MPIFHLGGHLPPTYQLTSKQNMHETFITCLIDNLLASWRASCSARMEAENDRRDSMASTASDSDICRTYNHEGLVQYSSVLEIICMQSSNPKYMYLIININDLIFSSGMIEGYLEWYESEWLEGNFVCCSHLPEEVLRSMGTIIVIRQNSN